MSELALPVRRSRTGVALAVAAAVVVAAVLLTAGPLAGPAAAHGRGSDATNFSSEITGPPPVDGLEWRVYGGDELLWLGTDGRREVIVVGYDGEPYLRFGGDGVWENANSPATYLNQDRYAQSGPPPGVDASAPPDWRQVSGDPSYAWHDHRMHWMSPSLPPSVADPDAGAMVTELSPWTVPVEVDGVAYEVVGQLRWVPGPAPWPWLAASLPLALLALVGLRTRPQPPADPAEPSTRWPGLARPAAALLGLVVLLNVGHLLDDFFAVPLPGSVVALSAVQTALFIAIGAFGALRAWQAGEGAFTALGVGAGAILIGQGLLYLPVLGASQIASVFPDWLARSTVALSLTQALTIGVVTVVGTRTVMGPAAPPAPATEREAS